MSYFRPAPASLAAFLAFLAWNWIATSGVNYDGTLRLSTFTTGGWYVLGFPFVAAMALGYSAFVAFMFRKQRWITGSASLAIVVALVVVSAYGALPSTRVTAIVGSRVGPNITIHRLSARDSFNEGVTTFGVISGPENTLESIATERSLSLKDDVPLFPLQRMFPQDGLPEFGSAYTDGRSTFYFHSDTNRIYFQR